MDGNVIRNYEHYYACKYFSPDVCRYYPEVSVLPGYLASNFSDARTVLDLGFGGGIWFWASFLPALERLDGMDIHEEALEEADKVFQFTGVPPGFAIAHRSIGSFFSMKSLRQLGSRRGVFVFQDYRDPWPASLTRQRYDLVVEHGGGLGELHSKSELVEVLKKVHGILRDGGAFFFANFSYDRNLSLLDNGCFLAGANEAGLEVRDYQRVHNARGPLGVSHYHFGYARKF